MWAMTSRAPDCASARSSGIVACALGVIPMSPKTPMPGLQPCEGGVTKEKAPEVLPRPSPTVYVYAVPGARPARRTRWMVCVFPELEKGSSSPSAVCGAPPAAVKVTMEGETWERVLHMMVREVSGSAPRVVCTPQGSVGPTGSAKARAARARRARVVRIFFYAGHAAYGLAGFVCAVVRAVGGVAGWCSASSGGAFLRGGLEGSWCNGEFRLGQQVTECRLGTASGSCKIKLKAPSLR